MSTANILEMIIKGLQTLNTAATFVEDVNSAFSWNRPATIDTIVSLYRAGDIAEACRLAANTIPADAPDNDMGAQIGSAMKNLDHFRAIHEDLTWRSLTTKRLMIDPYKVNLSLLSLRGMDIHEVRDRTVVALMIHDIGDFLEVASIFPELLERDNNLMIIPSDDRWLPLMKRSFPEATVLQASYRDLRDTIYPQNSLMLPAASILYYARSRCANFPQNPKPFLTPAPEAVSEWKRRFKALGKGLKIGISWRGGRIPEAIYRRSTNLDQWKPLFNVHGCHFVSLQYSKDAAEIVGTPVHDFPEIDGKKDLDGFAAQVAALDHVITIDNSTSFFAGALGVPCWTLLPWDFSRRWMHGVQDTPFFSSVRLYRQQAAEEWDPVFREVAGDLQRLITTGIMPEVDPERSYRRVFDLLEGKS